MAYLATTLLSVQTRRWAPLLGDLSNSASFVPSMLVSGVRQPCLSTVFIPQAKKYVQEEIVKVSKTRKLKVSATTALGAKLCSCVPHWMSKSRRQAFKIPSDRDIRQSAGF